MSKMISLIIRRYKFALPVTGAEFASAGTLVTSVDVLDSRVVLWQHCPDGPYQFEKLGTNADITVFHCFTSRSS